MTETQEWLKPLNYPHHGWPLSEHIEELARMVAEVDDDDTTHQGLFTLIVEAVRMYSHHGRSRGMTFGVALDHDLTAIAENLADEPLEPEAQAFLEVFHAQRAARQWHDRWSISGLEPVYSQKVARDISLKARNAYQAWLASQNQG